ncbi:unnamed protein product [Mytilus coruscus]|uniref:Uncharacterized protein n=1 Tax=Mytilus coruscus TaxID=42192 RepID=A0A6J8E9D0_MYTCO|nr:unnamed protein product [Mytilus coruscus]
MSNESTKLSLFVNEEQKETILSLFGYYNWNVKELNDEQVTCVIETTKTDEILENDDYNANEETAENRFVIQQNADSDECPFCLCKPCITDESNRQLWWETECQQRHRRNNSLRKEKYKYFWTMMYHRDVWRDDRYQERKLLALARDPKFKNFIWHKRDIMPNCVLKLVRNWHPNPDNIPYMGHLWE